MKLVKKIDIHAHITPYKHLCPNAMLSKVTMVDDNELIAIYDELNIEKGVLLPLVSPEYHSYVTTSAEAKLLSDKHPDRFVWFCNVDPRAYGHNPKAELSEQLMFFKGLGAKGVGEVTANIPADDPLMDNFFYHCAKCDMPVTIHIAPMSSQYGYYGIKDDLHLPRLEKMMNKHPDLKILGHSQMFWSELGDDVTEETRFIYPNSKVEGDGKIVKMLRELPNLYCDLSAGSGLNALMRDKEYAARFIEEFSDRVLFGLDVCAPSNTHQYRYEEFLTRMVEDKYISEENYYKFVRGNAIKLLNIE
ncbi:MAG: amidohydrolase [Clostridia bacterium]|nr:amidohydrolase [Clostridia bacterium]